MDLRKRKKKKKEFPLVLWPWSDCSVRLELKFRLAGCIQASLDELTSGPCQGCLPWRPVKRQVQDGGTSSARRKRSRQRQHLQLSHPTVRGAGHTEEFYSKEENCYPESKENPKGFRLPPHATEAISGGSHNVRVV